MSGAIIIPETRRGKDYREAPGLNQSGLKMFAKDPQLYYETYVAKTAPHKPPTKSQQFGLDLEQLLLYGTLPPDLIPIPEEVLNKDGHKKGSNWIDWEKDQLAQNPDAVLLKPAEYAARVEPISLAANSVWATPKARWLISEAQRHVAIQWTDEETGWLCKAELDLVRESAGPTFICDLKSTRDSRVHPTSGEGPFSRDIWSFGYNVQALWYREAYRQLTGEVCPFIFIAVENKPSYACETITLHDDWFALAEQQVAQYKQDLSRAYATEKWVRPTHGKLIQSRPPKYAAYDMPEETSEENGE